MDGAYRSMLFFARSKRPPSKVLYGGQALPLAPPLFLQTFGLPNFGHGLDLNKAELCHIERLSV